ncbi:MAG: Zn-dependent hydrolase [Acidiferrobacterales bacterium]|nr:Zn-dependent hydrolase [Acidiferrobacterales bacterium]
MSYSELRVNGDRLWDSLMRMAQIGATQKGGVCRLALTDLDLESRDLLSEWCFSEGCDRKVDPMGNLFFRRPGTSSDQRAVGSGSHLDTQPTGGKFDGAYGVMAALEVIRTMNDSDVSTELPVELVVWTNEEGSRFPPAMIGSAVYAGAFDLEYGHSRSDLDGRTMGEELKRIGYLGDSLPSDHQFSAFFEAHIEQGPILEEMNLPVGVVTGVQGSHWYDVTIVGEETHAGPTPMNRRRDALRGASELLPKIYRIATDSGFDARITLGEFRIYPGSRNTVPSRVEFTIDFRHPILTEFDRLDQQIKDTVNQFGEQSNLDVEIDHIWRSPPIAFDSNCIDVVRNSAKNCGYGFNEMVSGAGHDSVNISGVAPTSMIFVPCDGGVSHNEEENISKEQAEVGANVLLHSVLARAGISG